MRVDTKKPDVKRILSAGMAILIILLLSNLSLAEMADGIKDELDEHDVLSSLADKITGESKHNSISSTSARGSGTGSSSGSHSGSTGVHTEPVKTDLYSQMKRYTGYYNNGIDEVPDVVKKVAGNDVILLDIDMKDGSDLRIKTVTKDGTIVEFRKLSPTEDIDPTVTVSGDEDAIRGILKNDDPLGCLGSCLDQGSVDIECKGFLKKAALSALKTFA